MLINNMALPIFIKKIDCSYFGCGIKEKKKHNQGDDIFIGWELPSFCTTSFPLNTTFDLSSCEMFFGQTRLLFLSIRDFIFGSVRLSFWKCI